MIQCCHAQRPAHCTTCALRYVPQFLYVLTAADSSPAHTSTTGLLKPRYRPSAAVRQRQQQQQHV